MMKFIEGNFAPDAQEQMPTVNMGDDASIDEWLSFVSEHATSNDLDAYIREKKSDMKAKNVKAYVRNKKEKLQTILTFLTK